MNSRIQKLFNAADSRYLNAEEQTVILEYAASLQARFRTAAAVEAKEQAAVKYCIDEMRKRYPNFDKFHEQAWGKAFRDVQLTVRYCVQAMLLDDVGVLDDKLLVWLKTILASFNFTPQFNRDTYMLLKDGFRRLLPPEDFRMMEPYLNRNIETLSDFPEPAVPAV
jgi:hypothetical protein